MGRRLCIGDIHGCYDKLIDVLNKCNFSDSDILYSVGDFTDRGTQNVKTLDFLMGLKNFKPVCGNHDLWNYEYLHPAVSWTHVSPIDKSVRTGFTPYISRDAEECWVKWNGGKNTEAEEHGQSEEWKKRVYDFLKDIPYLIDLGDRVVIHTICKSKTYKYVYEPLDEITMETLKSSNLIRDDVYDERVWDRSLLPACRGFYPIQGGVLTEEVLSFYKRNFNDPMYNGEKIYIIGHTPLNRPFFDRDYGVIGIDTGAFCNKRDYGVDGCLTVLDMDSFEYWQSDKKGSFSL